MARSRRTRASRSLITFVVLAIALGSAVQFHRMRKPAIAQAKAPVVPVELAKTEPKMDALTMLAALQTSLAAGPSTKPSESLTPTIWVSPKTATPSVVKATPVAAVAPAVSVPVNPAGNSAKTLADAKAQAGNGEYLAARKALNDSLLAGNLSPADAESARKQIATINQTVIFSSKHFADDPFGGNYTVKPGEKLSAIASAHDTTWEFLLRLNNMSDPRKLRAGQSLKVVKGPFHVVVTKGSFTMDVYLGSPGEAGSMYVTRFPVGLGRDDSTPTGTWMVEPHHKLKHPTYYSPRGEGVIAADDPKNPLGPFWIGLSGTDGHAVGRMSYGIHGTIEPDSIGKMASLGCIRMQNSDVSVVYELLVEGKSTVIVRD